MHIIEYKINHIEKYGREPNKYETAIYEALVKEEAIHKDQEHIRRKLGGGVDMEIVEDIYTLIIQ